MNRRDLRRLEDINELINKKEKKEGFGFLDQLDIIDFRDDLRYK